MTTVENTTALVSAVIEAGVGGKIVARDGYEYIVGQDDSGDWNLTSAREDGAYQNEPVSNFDQNLNWRVVNSDSLGEFTETVTRAEFFRSLPQGAIIRMIGSRTRYVWVGTARNDEGQTVFRLVDERWADLLTYSSGDEDRENDWERVDLEEATPNTIRHIERVLYLRDENRRYDQSLQALSDKLDRVMADFQIVNDKLCHFAVERGYCPDFEERISEWNRELKELELLGRERQFSIAMRIEGMDDSPIFYMYPQARSEKQAREQVSQMGTRAIIEQMLNNGNYFDGLRFTMTSVDDEGVEN
jgi:hypothetical protein